jgi:hypothetical protein
MKAMYKASSTVQVTRMLAYQELLVEECSVVDKLAVANQEPQL